jgi:hypothetical protein
MRPSSSDTCRPLGARDPAVDGRLQRFKQMNEFVTARGGWITSLPGAVQITVETLPESSLRSDLRDLGFDLQEAGQGERILPAGIEERLMRRPDGTLGPVTTGSARLAVVLHQAGMVKIQRYLFDLN